MILHDDLKSPMVIMKLRKCFLTPGSPVLLSENGRQFTSADFKRFCTEWDITHKTSRPHYQQSNGLSECAVQSAKQLFEKCKI
jgi:transposase InsO family protein